MRRVWVFSSTVLEAKLAVVRSLVVPRSYNCVNRRGYWLVSWCVNDWVVGVRREGMEGLTTCCRTTSVEAVDAVVIILESFGNSIFFIFIRCFGGLKS